MKKKFKIISLVLSLFLFLLNSNSYSLSRCAALMEDIKNADNASEFQEHPYSKLYNPPFDVSLYYNSEIDEWIWGVDNKNYKVIDEDNEFIWALNENKNLTIGKIYDYEVLKGLEIGDEIIEINGKKVSEFSKDQLVDAIYSTDPSPKIVFLNSYGNKIEYDKGYIEKPEIVPVNIQLKIRNVSGINIKENTFQADMEINAIYKVPSIYDVSRKHLVINKDNNEFWMCKFTEDEFEEMQIWNPWIENINSIRQDKTLINREYIFQISDIWKGNEKYKDTSYDDNFVEITSKQFGTFTFTSEYFLKAFPFDKQKLVFQFADLSRDLDMQTLDSNLYNDRYLAYFKNNNKILEWRMLDTSTKYIKVENPEIYPTDGVQMIIEIERDYGYYIFKIILPMVLILLVCWSVFWIHPRELESKLTITIVCLLSLIAYNFVIDQDLPKLGYLTLMDYIILLSYIFATLPNFISIYSFQLYKNRNVKWKFIDSKSRIYGPLSYIFLLLFIIFFNSIDNPYTAGFLSFLR